MMRSADGPMFNSCRVTFLLTSAVLTASVSSAASAGRDALWKIVYDQCIRDEQVNHNPAPCARVDLNGGLDKGYVILKDRAGATQFLLIPTRKISGIESPEILLASAPSYWADAWQNRTYVSKAAKHDLAWDAIGLAINSQPVRSQDQLHIHIDCLQPDVRAALAAHMGGIAATWAALPFDLHGERYFARRLAAADLATEDPFKLLASGVAGAAEDMKDETLAVVGVMFAPATDGFVLLAARADAATGNRAHSEDLLDHGCALVAE
jgi:CDP-diacylglycerol pyrophosphatase